MRKADDTDRQVRSAFGLRESVWVLGILAVAVGVTIAGVVGTVGQIQTTRKNFFVPGTQPGSVTVALVDPSQCSYCHADYNRDWAPYNRWSASMMGQSARDPIFYAALAIAEQDVAFVGESCMRCHAPAAWLAGHVKFNTTEGDPSYGHVRLPLTVSDAQGVSCSVCHRMVDPISQLGNPVEDQAILAALSPAALADAHNGSFVIDPQDRRRGPFDLNADWAAINGFGWPGYHAYLQSPFHESSRMCATCHDASSAHFLKQSDGTYQLASLGIAPPSDKHQQFPEQRTYSEWSQSLFAQGPVNLNGRFGGNTATLEGGVSSCQDCHMPTTTGEGCALHPPARNDLPQHDFNGANSWVIAAVQNLYPQSVTGMTQTDVDASLARVRTMLAQASDLTLSAHARTLTARVTNYTGHKLPTGYAEGRRMWVNVKFFDSSDHLLAEHGAYDPSTGVLSQSDTKVYQARIGSDANVASLTGNTAGPGFHLALSNTVYSDNRIPPMGFTNAAFEAVQAGSVPAGLYADGQYWDDTNFTIPAGATIAEVSVYYQTTSKEYIEFLRDANMSNSAGQTAYDQWNLLGKSQPVKMDHALLTLHPACDWDQNGAINVSDIFAFLRDWFNHDADYDGNGATNVADIFAFLRGWFSRCT